MGATTLSLGLALGAFLAGGLAQAREPGVVVELVDPEGAAAAAGLRPGDVLGTWSLQAEPAQGSEAREGPLASPFSLAQLELEHAALEEVSLSGWRAGAALRVTLSARPWRLTVRPHLGADELQEYEGSLASVRSGQVEAGLARLHALALAAQGRGDRLTGAWALTRALELAGPSGSAELEQELEREVLAGEALAPLEGAVVLGRVAEAARARGVAPHEVELRLAVSLDKLGVIARNRSLLAAADRLHRRAVEMLERLAPGSLELASSLNNLGTVLSLGGDLAAAEDPYRRALVIRERLAPDSLEVAGSLANLGIVARGRGDLTAAAQLQGRALALFERLAPGSIQVAGSLNNLGLVARDRGDLAAAEDLYRRALEIGERLAPGSLRVAGSLTNLGNVSESRGDLASADELHRRALAIFERALPDSLEVATALNNLGLVAYQRGDLASAEDLYRRALALREKLTPGTANVAACLNNLGILAFDRGDLALAETLYRRALEILERLVPGGLEAAAALHNLGNVSRGRGDLDAAEALLRRALTLKQELAPEGLDVAYTLNNLGLVLWERGDRAAAATEFSRALEIRERLAPGSAPVAETSHSLAISLHDQGKRRQALEQLAHAVRSLESQLGRLGGTEEARSGFRSGFHDLYLRYIDYLVEEGRRSDAFAVLERSRARGLLAMLAERDLVFAVDLPDQLEQERRVTAVAYERTQDALGGLSPVEDAEEVERRLAELARLRARQDEIREEVRRLSPRLGSLQYPQPLDAPAAARALDPGTLLLSYSVGQESTHLFVLQPDGRLRVETLAVGESALRVQVQQLRGLIARARGGAAGSTGTREAGRQLYDQLLAPAAQALERSQRVLVIPDGPLHLLPWAALVRPAGGARGSSRPAQYLVEWKPIHVAVSATVYDELRQGRTASAARAGRLVAFGDPGYGTASDGQGAAAPPGAAPGARDRLVPLPATRAEVEGIARLFPRHASVYLEQEATEERAKAVGPGVRYLHFATHGLLDQRLPLDSALALAAPQVTSEENGMLQAWEVFEQLRVDSDLVVLSSCDSALGGELAGEGLIGLTRAFQYAGARSVVASLWSVADQSTAELMRRFYAQLQAGQPKDLALRQAQLELIHGPLRVSDELGEDAELDATHPFFWAPFQLFGDWR